MIKIVAKQNIEDLKKAHEGRMESNPEYKQTLESITFEKGKRIELAIEVTDEFLCKNIFNLFYDKVEGQELLGFKIHEVITHPEVRINQKAKEKVRQIVDQVNELSSKW